MQAVANPTALELSKEAKKVVEPNEFVNSTLDLRSEAMKWYNHIIRERQEAAQEAAQIAEKKAKEEMIIMALKCNAAPDVIETMQKGAGITDSRLAELKLEAQKA